MREARTRRDALFDLDLGPLLELAATLQATQAQYMMAYSRALRRTGATLRKMALAEIKDGIAPRKLQRFRQRIFVSSLSRGSVPDEMRLWFGLNSIKVKDLKGRISGRRQHQKRDPKTGRFIPLKKAGKHSFAEFQSKGSLGSTKYDNGVIARVRGTRTIRVYDAESQRSREAEVDIYAPMLDRIEDNVFQEVNAIFLRHFETDLRGRVKARVHVDKKTRKRI